MVVPVVAPWVLATAFLCWQCVDDPIWARWLGGKMETEERVGNIAYIIVVQSLLGLVAPEGHMAHTRIDGHLTPPTGASSLNLAQGNAAILILRSHLFPLLHLGNPRAPHRTKRVGHGLSALHVAQFEKGNWNQPRASETTDRFGDKPFRVRLGDDDNGLTGLGAQFVGSFGLKIILHDAIDHGALAFKSGHSEDAVFVGGRRGRKTVGRS